MISRQKMADYKPAFLADMLKESIRQGTTPSLTVTSNSMSPMLRAGDQVGLQELVPALAQPGQIITFSDSSNLDNLITHRMAGTSLVNGEVQFITYGDRTLLFDTPVALDNVVGFVVWRRRNSHILDLSSGQGAWLNAKLAKQSQIGLKRTTGIRPGIQDFDHTTAIRCNEHGQRFRKRASVRLLSRVNYLWASMLVLYTENFPKSCGGK
jgi:hypothetical protein